MPELRLSNITNIAAASAYLKHVFIPQFWRSHIEVKSKHQTSEFTPLSKHTKLDDICVIKDHRKIRNEHPHLGPQRVALKLTEAIRIDISANGVRSIWLRNDMNTTALRVERSQALHESA